MPQDINPELSPEDQEILKITNHCHGMLEHLSRLKITLDTMNECLEKLDD